MPQKMTCGNCGEVLYEGNDLKPPEEIVKQYNGLCPKCGKKLSFDPTKIDISVLQDKEKDRRK